MPPGVFPFDHDMTEEEIAENQIKLLTAGVVGEPGAVEPQSSPSCNASSSTSSPLDRPGCGERLIAARLPVALQRRRALARRRRQRLTRAEPGEAPSPNVTFETSWADWALDAPGRQPVKSILARPHPPRGKVRELMRMRKVFSRVRANEAATRPPSRLR